MWQENCIQEMHRTDGLYVISLHTKFTDDLLLVSLDFYKFGVQYTKFLG